MTDPEVPPSEPVIEWVSSSERLKIGLARRGGLDRISMPFPLLGMMLTGALEVRFGSRRSLFDPGSVMLLRPGDEGRVRYLATAPVGVCLALDPGMLHQAFAATGEPSERFATGVARFPPAAQSELLNLLSRASRGDRCDLGLEEVAFGTYARLTHWILEASPRPPATPPDDRSGRGVVHEARRILAVRYRERIRIPELASSVGCSAFHLCRLFKREAGMTIHSYLNQLRLREAALRLLDSDRDLMALAHDVGYCHHSHLSLAFRKQYGMSPSQWRTLVHRGGVKALRSAAGENGGSRPRLASGQALAGFEQ